MTLLPEVEKKIQQISDDRAKAEDMECDSMQYGAREMAEWLCELVEIEEFFPLVLEPIKRMVTRAEYLLRRKR